MTTLDLLERLTADARKARVADAAIERHNLIAGALMAAATFGRVGFLPAPALGTAFAAARG